MREISDEERFRGEDDARRMPEAGVSPQAFLEQGSETALISSIKRLQKIVASLLIRNEELRECIRRQDALLGEIEGLKTHRSSAKS